MRFVTKTEFVNPGETLTEYCNRTRLSPVDVKSFNEAIGEVEFVNLECAPDDSNCDNCGGVMTWCEGCRMYSKTCCEDYGTCLCS